MKFSVYGSVLFLMANLSQAVAQPDSTARSTYFIEQSALPSSKGSLAYNNYYAIVNSIAYHVTERLKISAGVVVIPGRPPFYAAVQYTLPITNQVFAGGSVGYYQLEYSERRSSYVVVPQLLLTVGNRQINTTVNGGVARGRFLFGGSLFPAAINLPNQVNLVVGLSHRRPLTKELSFITQNAYVSSTAPVGSRYAQVVLTSAGGAWNFGRNALKIGASAVFYPKSEQGSLSNFLPFLGYSYFIQ